MDYNSFKENEGLIDHIALETAKAHLAKKLPSNPLELETIARVSYTLAEKMVQEKEKLEEKCFENQKDKNE